MNYRRAAAGILTSLGFFTIAMTSAMSKETTIGEVNAMCFAPNGKIFITGEATGTIRVWTTDGWQLAYELKSQNDSIRSMDVSPDNSLLCIGTWESVELWDLQTRKLLFSFPEREVTRVFFAPLPPRSPRSEGPDTRSPPNELLTWKYGVLSTWDTRTGKLKKRVNSWQLLGMHGHDVMAVSYFGYPVFVYGEGTLFSGFLRVSNLESSDVLIPLDCSDFEQGPVVAVFSMAGPQVAAGFLDGSVGVWRTPSGKLLHTLQKHKEGVTAITFLRRDILLSSDEKGWIHVWDTAKGELLNSHKPADSRIQTMAVSDDGRSLAVGYGQHGTGRIFIIGEGSTHFKELMPDRASALTTE